MNHTPPTPVESEIEARFAYAGVVVPAERKRGAISQARAMLAATHWLRQSRTAAAEPSNTFSLVPGATK